jgi:hypothetical protein
MMLALSSAPQSGLPNLPCPRVPSTCFLIMPRACDHTRVRGQGVNRAFLWDPVSTNPAQIPPPIAVFLPFAVLLPVCLSVSGSLALCLSVCVWISRSLSVSLCVFVTIGLATNVLPLALHMYVQYDVVSHLTCKWPFRV